MIFQKILPKNSAKHLAFLTQNKAELCKILSLHWFLRKTPIFSPKIVIITSTPGHPDFEATSRKKKLRPKIPADARDSRR
jgi:hypothetical protein